jgi:hypothetical protein
VSGLAPRLHDGVYAFVCVPETTPTTGLGVVATVREAEGRTLVLPVAVAEAQGFEVLWRSRWITLELPTGLSMVGLTARFAAALAEDGVPCNVFAGAHHDHVFVPEADGLRAQALLAALSV